MSQVPLFIFVEGFRDRYFYSQVANAVCQNRGISFELVTAEELQGQGGGKTVLLEYFQLLRKRTSLIDRFKGKTTASIFFLDKDIDDFLRKKRRSLHVVYTDTYELENYFFIHGNLIQAVSSAASLDIGSVQAGLVERNAWRQHAASCWKEWVKLCLFAETRCLCSSPYYSRPKSQINDRVSGQLDAHKYGKHLNSVQNEAGMRDKQFKRSFTRLSKKVDRLYTTEQYDKIFKGKWYCCFLSEDVKRIAKRRRINSKGLSERIVNNLQLTLNFGDSWAEHFRGPIRHLLTQAGL